jgi:hypothetical protein
MDVFSFGRIMQEVFQRTRDRFVRWDSRGESDAIGKIPAT